MKKYLVLISTFLFVNFLQAQPIDYDHLDKEYRDVAVQALASVKISTKKWVEEVSLKHPSGNFDSSWVKAQVLSQFNNLHNDPGALSLMIFMFAYQKTVNEEARADRKISSMTKEQELNNKETKLAIDNKKIDQQKQEANERYDNSMKVANTQLATGAISSSNQVAGNKLLLKTDSLKQKTGKADINQNLKTNSGEGKDKDAADASRDRRRTMQDNIQKMLDIIAEAKRSGTL